MVSDQDGFDYNFVEPPDEEYKCPICLLVLRDPHQTECCGNHFCQRCIRKQLDTSPSMACPMCRVTNITTVLDKFFLRKVHALKLLCPQQSNGCPWVGELGDVKRHLDPVSGQCSAVFPCQYDCGQRLLASNLPAHHAECDHRPYRCDYCLDYRGTYAEVVRDHVPVCPRYPVPCPNGCSAKGIQRASVKKHLSKCPLSVVECEYKHIGCTAKINKQGMASHLSKKMSQHLKMASSAYLRAVQISDVHRTKGDLLSADVDSLTQKLAQAEAKLSRTESDLASIQQRVTEQDREIKGYVSQTQSLQAKLSNAHSQVQDQVTVNKELQQVIQKQAKQLSSQQLSVQTLQGKLTARDSEVKEYVAQIESMQANLKIEQNQAQSHLKSKKVLQQEVLTHRSEIQTYKAVIEAHQSDIKQLKNELGQKDLEQTSSALAIEELIARTYMLEQSLESKDALLHSMKSSLEGRVAEVRTLEQSVALREEQLHAFQAKYGILEPAADCTIA